VNVVYEKPLVETITRAIYAAKRENMEIKHVELSGEEHRQLLKELDLPSKDTGLLRRYMGVEIKIK
jgi:hypothetical protein